MERRMRMRSTSHSGTVSKPQMWAGRIISGLVVLFFVFDAGVKVAQAAPALEGTARLGYPVGLVLPIGIVQFACVILYLIPQTDVLGAILLTGYLGGATATQVRMQDPW